MLIQGCYLNVAFTCFLCKNHYLRGRIFSTGCSAVRLARVVRDDEAGGSNPLTPTRADSFS